MGFYRTDGKNVKSLSTDDVFGSGFEASAGQYDFNPRTYYTLVPFVRRAVNLRANAVAGVPITLQRGNTDLSKRPEFSALMAGLADLIWKTEFALCLSPYGAYWRRTANRAGLNPTPEWLLPQACWPFISAENGLEYIRYIHPWGVPRAGAVEHIPLDEIVYCWLPSLDRANWPGTTPGQTALAAASALTNRDSFVADYFRRGAIKGVLLQVPTGTSEPERNKLKLWWNQVFTGIRNAWRSIVISADVKPVIIGEGLKDTENEQLTLQYRQDVGAAFGVPESMLLSNAANYATAGVERISFYTETVFPQLKLILAAANKQWLRDAYDAELVAHPEQTEAMQDAQVQQAQAVTDLVGQPVLTVNEGRAWLGMEPLAEQDAQPQSEADEEADYRAMEEEEQQEEAEEEQPTKGILTPERMIRMAERDTLRLSHRAMRDQTRERHRAERLHARQVHADERKQANDAQSRLRLVQRHRNAMSILTQRQSAERQMMRKLLAAERGRLRDRHAVTRAFEEPAKQNGHRVEVLP